MSGALGWEGRTDEAIATIAAALARLDPSSVASLVVETCAKSFCPAALALYRTSEGGDELELVAQRGFSTAAIEASKHLSFGDGGLLASVARSRVVGQLDVTSSTARIFAARSSRSTPQYELGVPCLFRGRVLGVLELVVELEGPLPPPVQLRLETLGNVIGLALGESLSRQSAVESALAVERSHHAQTTIVDALSVVPEDQLQASVRRAFQGWPAHLETSVHDFITNVIQKVVDEARGLVGAEVAAIGIGDESDRPFSLWAVSGFPDAVRKAIGRIPRPVGVLGLVACRGDVLRIADVKRHPSFRGLPPGHPPVTSLLGVPIRYRGRALGNLYLANKLEAAEFTKEDEAAIRALASQTAIALQQAFLQASVEAQRAQTQSLLDSVPNGIMFVDADNRHVTANPSAMRLFGMTISTESGPEQYLDILRYPDGRPVPREALPSVRALEGEEHPHEQLVVVRHDGTKIPILTAAAPVRGFGRKLLGAVINFEDITHLCDLERLRNLELIREEFNATVAHDLRNPVQTVLAQIYSLLRRADGEQEVKVPVEALRRVERSATSLGRIAGLLLDAARVELKRIDIQREPKRLADVVVNLIESLRPRMDLDGHRLELVIEDRSIVFVDTVAFEQILTNLIDNAAKFSRAGEPIRVMLQSREHGVLVSVIDRGPGIPLADQDHVFDRLYHVTRGARPTSSEGRVGLGLGLFIVKGYVEAHGGRVSVESAPGKGSTFRVWLPVFAPPERDAGSPSPSRY